jgi:hypothetical protein
MFIRLEVLKDLARKADPKKPFKIVISCDNAWVNKGNGVMEGPKTEYQLVQEGKIFPEVAK